MKGVSGPSKAVPVFLWIFSQCLWLKVEVIFRLSWILTHAAGRRDLVIAASRAAIAAGADGLLIEVNIDPLTAKVDAQQTISTDQFKDLMFQINALAKSLGREL